MGSRGNKHRAKKNVGGCRGGARVGGGVPPRVPPAKGGGGTAPAPKRPERYLIAAHEAGHAVARMVLVGDLDYAKVNTDNSGGVTAGTAPLVGRDSTRAEIETALRVVFAGYAAERLLASNRRGVGKGAGVDRDQALQLANMGGLTHTDLRTVYLATAAFVAAHEVEIAAVAKALNGCGRLLGRRVAEIARAASAATSENGGIAA